MKIIRNCKIFNVLFICTSQNSQIGNTKKKKKKNIDMDELRVCVRVYICIMKHIESEWFVTFSLLSCWIYTEAQTNKTHFVL